MSVLSSTSWAATLWSHLGKVFTLRVEPRRQSRVSIQILNKIALTPVHSVHVVEFEGRRWVIGCHAQGITVLAGDTVLAGSKETAE